MTTSTTKVSRVRKDLDLKSRGRNVLKNGDSEAEAGMRPEYAAPSRERTPQIGRLARKEGHFGQKQKSVGELAGNGKSCVRESFGDQGAQRGRGEVGRSTT